MKVIRGLLILLLLAVLPACQLTARLSAAVATPTSLPTHTPTASPSITASPSATPTRTPAPTNTPTFTPSPTATQPPSATPAPTLTRLPVTPSALQLSVFEQLWSIVKEEYLYPDFNGANWDKVQDEFRQRIQAGLADEDFYAAMHEMIARLGDDHSTYLSPAEAQASNEEYAGSYQYVGIGVLVEPAPTHKLLTILLVFPGSPAEEAGLASHDNLLQVDGQPVLDENGANLNLLRGPEGTTITIAVQTPGQAVRQVRVTRRPINGSYPVPHQVYTTASGQQIGYLLLATLGDSTIPDKVAQAWTEMTAGGELDGLIIDNRLNTGGADTVLEGVLSYFTRGVVGYFVDRQKREPLTITPQDLNGSQTVPLVILTGPGTVSFGEIFSGLLKDNQRAYLIGENTAGNVEILYVYHLGDGSRAWIAHDTFAPANQPEIRWEGTGVAPNLVIVSNWYEVTSATDPLIKAALSYFDKINQ